MALRFGKKKSDDDNLNGEPARPAVAFEPQPEKARTWFEQARKMSDSSNHEAALRYYAEGIKLDPTRHSAHEAMFSSALRYAKAGGKPAAGRDVKKIDGPHPVDKFAAAEYAWLTDLNNGSAAMKFIEASIKVREHGGEAGRWHCPRVLNVLRNQKKPAKGTLLAAKDLFAELGAWDEAIAAGEAALALDPRDASLQNELKDLAAQRAMDQGRYEEAAGEEGGFRKFVKDADKQRQLEEQESISGGLDVEQRNLQRAKVEYEKDPAVPDAINRYGQLLKAAGTDDTRKLAFDVFMKGYKDTGQYRFRAAAGDLRIEHAQVRLRALAEKLEGADGDSELQAKYDETRRKVLDLQQTEFTERVKEYPTDRGLKHLLGEVLYEKGLFHEAMQCFQESKDDPKRRVRGGHMLGRCFAAVGWHDEAIGEYKEALEKVEPGDKEAELGIRYDLMVSLLEQARLASSADLAREALEICSIIVRKDITYRDIRSRRKEADDLVRSLGAASKASDGQ